MAAKKVKVILKLNLPAGSATPAPPVGPALGQHGVPIMEFVKQYNDKTKDQKGEIIPAVITVFEDRTFTFITKLPLWPPLTTRTLVPPIGGETASAVGRGRRRFTH